LGITGGVAWGKTTQLSKAISKDGENPDTATINPNYSSVPTYEELKRGWFVGIVWNLSRK